MLSALPLCSLQMPCCTSLVASAIVHFLRQRRLVSSRTARVLLAELCCHACHDRRQACRLIAVAIVAEGLLRGGGARGIQQDDARARVVLRNALQCTDKWLRSRLL